MSYHLFLPFCVLSNILQILICLASAFALINCSKKKAAPPVPEVKEAAPPPEEEDLSARVDDFKKFGKRSPLISMVSETEFMPKQGPKQEDELEVELPFDVGGDDLAAGVPVEDLAVPPEVPEMGESKKTNKRVSKVSKKSEKSEGTQEEDKAEKKALKTDVSQMTTKVSQDKSALVSRQSQETDTNVSLRCKLVLPLATSTEPKSPAAGNVSSRNAAGKSPARSSVEKRSRRSNYTKPSLITDKSQKNTTLHSGSK